MEKKIDRFTKIYPWYAGFTGDLLFYIAIDTLFLTIVKKFSPAQIVSLTSFSQIACIALQFPILFIIKRIGNTASTRTGALFLLLSAILITSGKSYHHVLLGRIFHDVAAIFRTVSTVSLENNLELAGKRRDFIRIRTSGNTIYSIITMLISFVASYMFNLNHYLPMIGCITTCTAGFVLSLFMKDYSDYNKISYGKKKNGKVKVHCNKFVIIAIIVYAMFYPIVSTGQSEGKLFIQQHVLLDFNADNTALIIGAIVCVSRIIRVFSNIIFARLYENYQAKMGIALPVLLSFSMGFLLFGSFIPPIFVKIAVMSVGYIIILFARDPFRLYMQDVLFENTPKEQHQTLLSIFDFGVKVGTAAIGLAFSAILLSYPMIAVITILFVLSIIEIILGIKLYIMILAAKTLKTQAAQ